MDGGDAVEGECIPHIVQGFETLSKIALRYDMTVASLKELNNLRHTSLYPGQQIFVIPKSPQRTKEPEPTTKVTTDTISHTVGPRESLSTIALIYNTKAATLKSLNNLSTDHLTEGQILKVTKPSKKPTVQVPPLSLKPRQRSRSLNSNTVLRVFSPGEFASVKVPNGAVPHIVSNGETIEDLAQLYSMEENEIKKLNHLSSPELESGKIVFVKEKEVPLTRSADGDLASLALKLIDISSEVPKQEKFALKRVEEIFEEFRAQGAQYRYQAPFHARNMIREPCRYLVGGSDRNILGVASITDCALLFEPHPQDDDVKLKGLAACRFYINMKDIFAPLITKEDEVKNSKKGLALDFGVPGSSLRYLHISKLVTPEDEKSDVESYFYLAIHTERIEWFYCTLLEALCSLKEREETVEPQATSLTPRGTQQSDVLYKIPAPLLEKSSLLRDTHAEGLTAIRNLLPRRYGYRPWTLVYSTEKHGMTLRSFYSKAIHWEASVMIIEDNKGHVFGGFVGDPWEVNDSYYGNGESFVFRLFPRLDLYSWIPNSNNYFMLGKKDHIEMGGGGNPALWIDEEIKMGFSGKSKTFGNECLASCEDFQIVVMELWSFSSDIVLE